MSRDYHYQPPLTLRNIVLVLVILLTRVHDVVLVGEVTCVPVNNDEVCTVKVTENIPQGTTIFDVLEHYPNINLIIHSAITKMVPYLTLESDRYVQTVGDFDREEMVDATTAPYPLYFQASFFYNQNNDILKILANISVEDIDDNVPTFYINNKLVTDNSVTIETPETTTDISKLITTLVARDYDEGVNGTQEYSLGEGSSTYFNITVETPNNGVPIVRLLSNGELDREEKAHHNVYIIAKEGNDAPNTTMVNISISLIDLDDNTPSFATTEYSQVVFENATVGTSVVQVVAEDPDYGSNAAINYDIDNICSKETKGASCKTVTESSWPFALNTESGMLTLSEMLNYEDAVSYIVTITAKNPNNPDGGSSTAIVAVEVRDINDHAPQVVSFSPSDPSGAVAENAIIGSLVANFAIVDDDSDEYSLNYLLLQDAETKENSTHFEIKITPSIKTVVLKSSLDRETQDMYNLVLVATDLLNTSLSSSYPFTILVSDINDHAPVISSVPNPIYLEENSPVNTLILQLNATDKDIGINAQVKFSLPPESDELPYQDMFSIGQTDGKLHVKEVPDREMTPNLYVEVVAQDKNGGSDGLTSNMVVNISLTDENDNAPVFTSIIIKDIQVKENDTQGKEILDVDASDADIGENAELTFSVSSSSTLPVSINPETGVITLSSTLDYETTQSYSIQVSVTDGHNTPATKSFNLVVLDINDNNPHFPQQVYFKSLHENASINTHVVSVKAKDADSAEFTQISYSFSDDFDHSHFNLDSKTGEITTASSFDWEVTPKYILEVIANDGNGRVSVVNANVTVTITDVNDEIPQFSDEPYIFTVEENVITGGFVGQVKASSKEKGDHGKAVFSIINTSPVPFEINPETGVISANGTIDREMQNMYTLVIKVDDLAPPINDNTTEALVIVTDKNDNPPIFENNLVQIELSELYAVNSGFYTAIATDKDLHPNNITVYSLENMGTQFQIDSGTGELSLTSSLNYELQKSVLVDIIATDSGNPFYFDKMQLNITVLDDNNTNITFPSDFPLQYIIQENVPLDTLLLNFTAHDSKGFPQPHLNYYISHKDGSTATNFGIDVDTGSGYALLMTAGNLDREVQESYNLNITVTDNNTPPNKVTQFLTVSLSDVNDNPPTFTSSQYSFAFNEEQPGVVGIGKVKANDPDLGENGTITYSLQDSSEYFTIDGSSGLLSQLQLLDRELMESYTFVVVATDNGTPSKKTTTSVTVNLTDVNDHYPDYSPVFITVEENIHTGTIVANIIGSDMDIGENGEVSFEVDGDKHSTASSHFLLYQNGTLVVIKVPDYEEMKSFIFYIKVSDNGNPKRETFGNLTIRITDQNDNPPIFTGTDEFYTVGVPEDKLQGHIVLNIEAKDDDTGLAGVVNYVLESKADGKQFDLNTDSGVMTLKQSLDYETNTTHVVTVLAYDNGRPRNWVSRQVVTVNVINVDDNDPKFDTDRYSFIVEENQLAQTLVGTLRAYDADTGPDDGLTYTMSQLIPEGSNNFMVSQTGEYARITTLTELDHELHSYYLLELTAHSKLKNDTALVQIYVENLNDEKPSFSKSNYPVTVHEETSIGTSLVFVKATDADNVTNDAVWYSITNGNDDEVFYIDSATGEIRLNGELDYETTTSYTLEITATDTGVPVQSSTSTVTVTVLNDNEHSPVFTTSKYSFNLQEEQNDVTTIGQVVANDVDADSDIQYSLKNPSDYFTVDSSTGTIKTKVSIDREVTPTFDDFIVVATDTIEGGSSVETTVSITVTDINDNIPLFSNSLYQFSIPFDKSSYESIGVVSATDADSPDNSVTIYNLSNLPNGYPFGVNSSTGDIYLTSALPSDYKPSYKFTLVATDGGDSTFTNQTMVEVFTYTSDDHPPFFEEVLYEVNVTEEELPAEVGPLVTVKATDEDGGTLVYSLEDNYQKFSIGSNNGIISLTESLDYETVESYTITAYAADNGTPSRIASTTVIVTVINANDNKPQFENLLSSITLSPVPFINVNVFQMEASDADHSAFTFQLLSQTNKFAIDSTTGMVSNIVVLESGDTFGLNFRVTDGVNHQSTTVTVSVATPPSDSPKFTKDMLNLTVSESESKGYNVHTFTAINPSEYNIVCCGSSVDDMFTINTGTGVLSLKNQLDYETTTHYTLVIEALEEGADDVIHSDYQKVSLSVSNVNEYSPMFTGSPDKQVTDGLMGEEVITQVEAHDDDIGAFGEISFSIIDGNSEQKFTIDSETGVISLPSGKTLDRETTPQYELLVKATDGGSKSSNKLVTITITDNNDSPPSYSGNFTIGVYETANSGDRIIQVLANDPDIISKPSYSIGIVESYLKSEYVGVATNMFLINKTTAVVTLQGDLDRETVDLYVIQVSATDEISTATTFLHVEVLDVNDNPPEFSHNYGNIEIEELRPIGYELVHIMANDLDSKHTGIIEYSLGDNWPDGSFVIDEMSGVIRVADKIYFTGSCNEDNQFTGTVSATDGIYTITVDITITIIDINDKPPVFSMEQNSLRVSETAQENYVISTMTVTDTDCELNSNFDTDLPEYYHYPYELFSFKVSNDDDEKYELKVKGPLVQGVYHFRVEAFNSFPLPNELQYFLSSFATFTVDVLPENVHTPSFQHDKYTFIIDEDVVMSYVLGSVQAHDSDLGEAGYLTYSIMDKGVAHFSINSSTGEIIVAKPLDYETMPAYNIVVIATDSGYPTKSVNTTITIELTDINDNPPVFSTTLYETVISESIAPGTVIMRLTINDSDTAISNTTLFAINDLENGRQSPFAINSRTGVIHVTEYIDYEQNSSFDLSVSVRDAQLLGHESTCSVLIIVTGENEFPPVFPPTSRISFEVSENSMMNDYVGDVTAVDSDSGDDGVLTYSITNRPDPNFFYILPNGSLYLTEEFTQENIMKAAAASNNGDERINKRQTDNMLVIVGEVTVVDGGPSPRSASTNITLIVTMTSPTITEIGTSESIPISAIGAVGGFGVFLIIVVVVILIAGMAYKRSRRGKNKFTPGAENPQQASFRSSTPGTTTSQVELNNYVSTEGSGNNARDNTYVETEIQNSSPSNNSNSESNDGTGVRYHQYSRSPNTRSTSDLASSVATDALNLTQETSFQYSKAQLEQIYTMNINLLNDHSQDSVHMFGSEGGGEAEGDEMDDMMFAKYGMELEGNDDSSYCGKSHNSLSECSEEGRDVYQFSQSTNPWSSRHSIVDRSMNELVSEGSRPMMYHFEPSQPVMYGGTSTQGSTVSLTRSLHHRNKYGSERDIPHQYPPPMHHHHGHPPNGQHHHTHVPRYEYYPEVPHPNRRAGSPIMEYRSESKKLQELPPPPYLSQDPVYYRGNQYYHTGSSISPDPNQPMPQYEALLSTSTTSLSTNASHSRVGRPYNLPPLTREQRYH